MRIFIITIIAFLSIFGVSPSVYALPSSFDREMVLTDQDLYSLPLAFSSAEKIQSYLESQNSVLALTKVDVGFVDNGENDITNTDDLILASSNINLLDKYSPRKQVQDQYANKQLRPADIIWKIAQENFGNTCKLDYSTGIVRPDTSICIDNEYRSINPTFILSMIQKESSLVYGSCAKPDADYNLACQYSNPNNINKLSFRIDRAMGYGCYEIIVEKDKEKSCYDVNLDWKFQKGFFQQVYKGIRMLRIRSEICNISNFNGYKTGDIKLIDGINVLLKNGITCALYIYTPHISYDKINIYNNLKYFGADYNLIKNNGLTPDYKPEKIKKF
ncbi:MAG: hypothetical protein H7196_02125 [candidate division SR1 bacterium]|nr:hypothetical protein [candidate division SR1 bacterium]